MISEVPLVSSADYSRETFTIYRAPNLPIAYYVRK